MNVSESQRHGPHATLPARRRGPPAEAQADDIVAELLDDLLSRVEEQEARLGRQLNTEEQVALLRERGYPLLVATRYLPQQWLVGPALFPYRRLGLQYVLVGAALLHVEQFVLAECHSSCAPVAYAWRLSRRSRAESRPVGALVRGRQLQGQPGKMHQSDP